MSDENQSYVLLFVKRPYESGVQQAQWNDWLKCANDTIASKETTSHIVQIHEGLLLIPLRTEMNALLELVQAAKTRQIVHKLFLIEGDVTPIS